MISLKYLSNFCRTLKMLLIISEINVDLNLSKNWALVSNNANQATTFSITDTKNVPAVTLLTQENEKRLEQFKPGLKRTINQNKYQSKISDTKLYVPVVTLLTQENGKLFDQLKSAVKRTINWKKYRSKISTERQN